MVKRKTSRLENTSPRGTTIVTGDGIFEGAPSAPARNSASAENNPAKPAFKTLMNTAAITAGFAKAVEVALGLHRAESRPVYSVGSDNKIKKS